MEINLENILDNVFAGVYYVDNERKIKYWNKEAENITGYSSNEVVGNFCYNNILQHVNEEGINLCQNGCPLHASLNDGKKRIAEVYLHHKDGHRVPVLSKVVPIRDENNEIIGAVELFLKNRKRKSLEEKLIKMEKENYMDELTNISNRKYMENILEKLVSKENIENENIIFCFLDIDDFKDINDNYGHIMGDKILTMVANTLDDNIRPSDKAFRWGGDEFALILFDLNNKKELQILLTRLKLLINNSFIYFKEEKLSVTMSFGAVSIKDDDTIKSLIKRADENMYESKKKGKNRITIL